ncbi:hypothetical protein FW774_01690 (plasmid) [Pedobacter sp. BS3]|uniref:hypothetical protein n=1 Tax=Pedobacter sp. BS3 TaxID=2567937 RepID=UPI0011EDE5D3|nr:hypothetical protein [Pedobacter sp. BS3]TZF85809.1 hypothetical protein FW774_01690 [Pedobacter sp. BS3]
MVTITGYEKRQGEQQEFFLLQLQGDIEIVYSQTTGQPYATVRKTLMSTTFNEATCQALIGKQLPGNITKVSTEPYEYTIPETGEVKTLDYRYQYAPEETQTVEEAVFA